MSYPQSLDEVDEAKLLKELERRKGCRDRGCCDYCGQLYDRPACKFPERHQDPIRAAVRAIVEEVHGPLGSRVVAVESIMTLINRVKES